MSRRSNQKLKLLYLSKIFTELTDEQHGLTLTEISRELEKYGIKCGRKCLYDDIEALRLFGMKIYTRRDRYVRYYAMLQKFDLSEICLLEDFLSNCRFAPEKKKAELARKISECGNLSHGLTLKTSNDLDIRKKSALQLEEAYKNIGIICMAMEQDKKICFKRFEWNSKKQRILVSGGDLFCVSPWRLKHINEKYILTAFDDSNCEWLEFNIERLVNISLINQKREGDFKGTTEPIPEMLRFKCSNSPHILGEVFERFGLEITIITDREDCVEFSAKAVADFELFQWLFLHGKEIQLLAPDRAVAQYSEMLRKAQKNVYEKK